jgi:hypothetical protein
MTNGDIPRYRQPKFWADWIERVLWTLAQAGVGLVAIDQFDLPLWLVPIAAAGLSALKGLVAKQIGNKDSASTAPGV